MTKREALEKCMDQWQRIHNELVKMSSATLVIVPTLNQLKRKALREAGVSDSGYPLNACYLCEYVQTQHPTQHPTPRREPLACEYCPLKGYAWDQCEDKGSSYTDFCEAYDSDHFEVAADYALKIIAACERALEDLDNEE